MSVWHKLHCYSTGLIYVFIGLYILLYFYYFISTSFVSGIYAHNAMPKKISTKCNVFLQFIILRPHPHFTRHVRKKNPQNHPNFTRLKIRRSADPQIRILPEACGWYGTEVIMSVLPQMSPCDAKITNFSIPELAELAVAANPSYRNEEYAEIPKLQRTTPRQNYVTWCPCIRKKFSIETYEQLFQ